MADIYVRSTDGSDADNGSTWALAKATLNGAAGIDVAGDNIYISQSHAESNAAVVTWNFAGTITSPVKIIGVNDAAEPPTSMAATKPSISTTVANSITVNGSVLFDNVAFNLGSGASNPSMTMSATPGNAQRYRNCDFTLVATGAGSFSVTSGNSNEKTVWENCTVKFGGVNQAINSGRGEFYWYGGSIASGSTATTNLFNNPGTNGTMHLMVDGVDLSNGSSSMNIFNSGSGVGAVCLLRNCKLPSNWTGSLVTGTLHPAARFEMHNCDSADTNYRMWVEDYTGSIKSETTLVRTNGASDGTTSVSWKLVTNSSTNEFGGTLETPHIYIWNENVGSTITLTIDILHDSLTNLKDNEVWLEAESLSTTGFPLGTVVTDRRATVLTTPADQTTSSSTWTTTGMTNPNKQKLSVTLTPKEKGYLTLKVVCAKASYTLYVDPKVQVS